MSDDLFNTIYNKSLDLLSRREHSFKEIKDKLSARFENKKIIESVIEKLSDNNLVNNTRYAEAYVSARKRKGFGPKKIAFELSSKGVDESVTNSVIIEEGDWESAAKLAFSKKFKDGPSPDIKEKLKQKSFLQNRGFRFKEIESVFGNDMLWFNAMSYEVLARKYRPSCFEEVIGQEHVVKALINSIESEKIHQAFIFSGTRGVGKTTIARILAKCLNCESSTKPTSVPCNKCSNTIEITAGRSVDFLEIDAASNTQVEKIRDLIETVEYKPAKGRYKIFLIDEVHMLSTASFNALLKTLEEPPPHVVFIFATTNPEKIPKTVQSRCLQLNLKTVNEEMLNNHLNQILKKEKIKHDDKSTELISKSANGSVRDALTILDQAIAHGNGELNSNEVKKLLGTIDDSLLFELLEGVVDGDGKKVFDKLAEIEQLLPEYDVILRDLISILHQVSLEQVLNNSESENIISISKKIDKEFCQLLYEIGMNSFTRFSVHPSPKECLEICLLRMLTFNPLQKLSENNQNSNPGNAEKKSLKKVDEEIKRDNSPSSEESSEKKFLNNNEDWVKLFNSLELSPFARNYFGNMSLLLHNDEGMILKADINLGEVPENIMSEFKTTVESIFLNKINIKIEKGDVINSPIQLNESKIEEEENLAKDQISKDKEIQDFVEKFNGKIKPETIKPSK